ncbi:MAG: hypothetical protein ACTTJS_06995 [Wolinella sp.]
MKISVKFGAVALLLAGQFAFAHTALMNCFDNGDKTITCEGGFSDGSSAAGVKVKIIQDGKTIHETKFDKDNQATLPRPDGAYSALFDGGDGHQVEIKSDKILN